MTGYSRYSLDNKTRCLGPVPGEPPITNYLRAGEVTSMKNKWCYLWSAWLITAAINQGAIRVSRFICALGVINSFHQRSFWRAECATSATISPANDITKSLFMCAPQYQRPTFGICQSAKFVCACLYLGASATARRRQRRRRVCLAWVNWANKTPVFDGSASRLIARQHKGELTADWHADMKALIDAFQANNSCIELMQI